MPAGRVQSMGKLIKRRKFLTYGGMMKINPYLIPHNDITKS